MSRVISGRGRDRRGRVLAFSAPATAQDACRRSNNCWRSRWRSSPNSRACTRACSSRRRRSRRCASAHGRRTKTSGRGRWRRSCAARPGASSAAGAAGAPIPERRGAADRGHEPRLCRRAGPEVPEGGESVDARGHRLRALGLYLQQAEHGPGGGPPALRDRLGVQLALSRVDAGERARIRQSLERHAGLVYDAFAPKPKRRHSFTQNHNFIPTAGLAVTALALMGESPDAPKWAALARAHHHRAGQLLSPDGYYYEGVEYLDLLRALARALPRRVGALDG